MELTFRNALPLVALLGAGVACASASTSGEQEGPPDAEPGSDDGGVTAEGLDAHADAPAGPPVFTSEDCGPDNGATAPPDGVADIAWSGSTLWSVGPSFWTGKRDDPRPGFIARNVDGKWECAKTDDGLNAIWVAADDDVWAVGQGGTIFHYDGRSLQKTSAPKVELPHDAGAATAVDLRTLWRSSPTDIWAAGRISVNGSSSAGVVLHFDGTTWSSATVTAMPTYRLWAFAPDDVFALGGQLNQNFASRFDGKAWSHELSALSQFAIYGAVGTKSGELYAAADQGDVYRYDRAKTSFLQIGRVEESGFLYDAVVTPSGSLYLLSENAIFLMKDNVETKVAAFGGYRARWKPDAERVLVAGEGITSWDPKTSQTETLW